MAAFWNKVFDWRDRKTNDKKNATNKQFPSTIYYEKIEKRKTNWKRKLIIKTNFDPTKAKLSLLLLYYYH